MKNKLLIVSYGVGLDSTAMLIEMKNKNISPDLILFSDTGAEKPETYEYIPYMNEWLESVGFPQITIVKYQPKTAPYNTLEGKCLENETLPSLSFGKHSCAIVFKRDVQVKYLKSWQPAIDAIAKGERIIKAIGYDDSKADRRRRAKADKSTIKIQARVDQRLAECKKPLADQWEAAHCDFWYPLQDWSLERDQLAKIIQDEGLPVPCKSACFFCPASQPSEIVELKINHPDLYERAVAMEDKARNGRHGLTSNKGLPMAKTWAWSDLKYCYDPLDAKDYLKRILQVEDKQGLRP